MQTVSGSWATNVAAPVRTIGHGVQLSWPRTVVTSSFFTIGTSTIGGPDIIKSGGTAVAFFDKFQYSDYSKYAMSWNVERKIGQYPYGVIMAQADLDFDNSSKLFTPGFDGTIGSYVDKPNRPLKISVAINGESMQQFVGFTTMPETNRQARTMTLHAYDVFNYINGFESSLQAMAGLRFDEVVAAGLAEMGFSSTQYALDRSLQQPIGFLAPKGLKWGDIFQRGCEAEQALMFADENGIIRLWNRQHFLSNSSIVHTLTFSNMQDLEAQSTAVFNSVKVTAKPRSVRLDQKVYEQQAAVILPVGATDVFVDFADEFGPLPVTTVDLPASGGSTSRYRANTAQDETGTDLTASVALSSYYLFGTTMRLTFTNSSTSSVYLTSLILYGTPARVVSVIEQTYLDQTSIDNYGLNPGNNYQPLEIENDYIQDSSTAYSLAYTLVKEYKDPHRRYEAQMFANPALQIGDFLTARLTDGMALSLDGSGSSYVTVPTATQLDLTGDFTILAWINPTTMPTVIEMMERGPLGSVRAGSWKVSLQSSGKITFTIVSVVDITDPGSAVAAAGTWNEIAITRSGNTFSFYLNGNLSGTVTNSSAVTSNTDPLIIGRRSGGVPDAVNGLIDSVRIIKGTALTTAQIGSIYSTITSPVAYTSEYRFDEGSGTTALDRSTNANHGTITLPTYTNSLVPTEIKSMYFTGSKVHLGTGGDLQQTSWLEERTIQSYFTINTSTIGGTDLIAP